MDVSNIARLRYCGAALGLTNGYLSCKGTPVRALQRRGSIINTEILRCISLVMGSFNALCKKSLANFVLDCFWIIKNIFGTQHFFDDKINVCAQKCWILSLSV